MAEAAHPSGRLARDAHFDQPPLVLLQCSKPQSLLLVHASTFALFSKRREQEPKKDGTRSSVVQGEIQGQPW